MKSDTSIKGLTKTAMMATLIFVSMYLIKIPVPNGYTHIGDCMIFLSVILLGTKQGALASGIGGAVCDLLTGYLLWAAPTFLIKFCMAFLMGIFIEKVMPHAKWNWLLGATIGGIVQCVLYTAMDCVMFGVAYGIADIPSMILQTTVGILFCGVLVTVLTKSGMLYRLKE